MQNIKKLQNFHEKAECVIIATGPSINDIDLEALDKYITIGIGQLGNFIQKSGWEPDYLVNWDIICPEYIHSRSNDREWLASELQIITDDTDTELIAPDGTGEIINRPRDVIEYPWEKLDYYPHNPRYMDVNEVKRTNKTWEELNPEDYFNVDFSRPIISFGGTFTVAFQIAVGMGFEKILLAGFDFFVDHHYHMIFPDAANPVNVATYPSTFRNTIKLLQQPKPVKSAINGIAFKLVDALPARLFTDPNHYDPNYAPKDWIIAEEKNERSKPAHRLVLQATRARDVEIINVSPGELDVYPCRSLQIYS